MKQSLLLFSLVFAPIALAGASSAQESVLQLFEVRDLAIELAPPGFEDAVAEGEEPDEERIARHVTHTTRALADLIEHHCEPGFESGVSSIHPLEDGTLIVRATPEQQGWVESFLLMQRRFRGLIHVQTRFVVARPGELTFGSEPESAHLIAESAFRDLVARSDDGDATVLTAPQLVVHPRQKGSVSVFNSISYVSSWSEHRVEPNGQLVLDPQVDILEEGVSVVSRVTPLPSGLYAMSVDISYCDVARPIPTERVRVGGRSVEISVPEVTRAHLESTLHLAEGGAAIFTTDVSPDRELVVLIRMDVVERAEDMEKVLLPPGERRHAR